MPSTIFSKEWLNSIIIGSTVIFLESLIHKDGCMHYQSMDYRIKWLSNVKGCSQSKFRIKYGKCKVNKKKKAIYMGVANSERVWYCNVSFIMRV